MTKKTDFLASEINGGESGIRTHGTFEGTHTFQACALNHSAISPNKGQSISGPKRRVSKRSHMDIIG